MKQWRAILIIILSIIIQTSFVRLLGLPPIAPNLSLVALFLLCYALPFERILILAIAAGMAIDLFSSVSFGSTSLAALGACSFSFYLRENVLKRGKLADFFLNSLIAFFVFYFLLSAANILMKPSTDYAEFFLLMNINLAGEIVLNSALAVLGYYFLEYCKNNKLYGFVRNSKISS